jgi:hypothetical protein
MKMFGHPNSFEKYGTGPNKSNTILSSASKSLGVVGIHLKIFINE